jgi:hypothetical protein
MLSTLEPRARIVLGLDAGAAGEEAMRDAGSLARSFGAELAVVFADDGTLVGMAASPLFTLVGPGGDLRRPSAEEMRRSVRATAAVQRQRVEQLAKRLDVRWSFRVAEGTLIGELVSAATAQDMVLVAPLRRDLQRGGIAVLSRDHAELLGPARVLAERLAPRGGRALPVIAIAETEPDAIAGALAVSASRLLVAPRDGASAAVVDTLRPLLRCAVAWLPTPPGQRAR